MVHVIIVRLDFGVSDGNGEREHRAILSVGIGAIKFRRRSGVRYISARCLSLNESINIKCYLNVSQNTKHLTYFY